MASELTRVAYSANVEEAAFNLNAKANELGNTIAGVWNLKPTDNNAAPESAFAHNPTNDLRESKIGQPDQDGRKKVDESDFMQGGKYRCKLCSIQYCGNILRLFSSHRESLYSLRISRSGRVCHGNRLAYQSRHPDYCGPYGL